MADFQEWLGKFDCSKVVTSDKHCLFVFLFVSPGVIGLETVWLPVDNGIPSRAVSLTRSPSVTITPQVCHCVCTCAYGYTKWALTGSMVE